MSDKTPAEKYLEYAIQCEAAAREYLALIDETDTAIHNQALANLAYWEKEVIDRRALLETA